MCTYCYYLVYDTISYLKSLCRVVFKKVKFLPTFQPQSFYENMAVFGVTKSYLIDNTAGY